MIKQIIVNRKYTTHTERETIGSATYKTEVKEYENFESFVDRVTNASNRLEANQIAISISYPAVTLAVIAYKEI